MADLVNSAPGQCRPLKNWEAKLIPSGRGAGGRAGEGGRRGG